ncbi:response regulator [Psychrobacillus sp. FJAT-51614]|uniref:Response regulator n=1 Tax=Psychrobacillus mangrovi TaxID=3117745 RepID=A0ABU8F5E4_9BACI
MFTNNSNINPRNKLGLLLLIAEDLTEVSSIKNDLETEGYTTLVAPNVEKGIDLFNTNEIDVCCVSTNLSDSSAFTFLDKMKQTAQERFIPILVLNFNNEFSSIKTEFIRHGATDMIHPKKGNNLLLAIVSNILSHRNFIKHLQSIDPLTGALNYASFEKKALDLIDTFNNEGTTFSLSIIEVHDLQQKNKDFGFSYTNEILSTFSELVHTNISPKESFYRLHGATFALLHPATKVEEALKKLENLNKSFLSNTFDKDGQSFHIQIVSGIAEWNSSYEHIQQLVVNGKQALSVAKQSKEPSCISYNDMNLESIKPIVRVFIVDDNKLSRTMLEKQFFSWHSPRFQIEVSVMDNGFDFIHSDWYHPADYHILLLDVIMPKMDGLEVLNYIREKYPSDRIIISMLTSRNNDQDIIHALNIGADDYLIKPFHPQEVLARIQRLASRLFV